MDGLINWQYLETLTNWGSKKDNTSAQSFANGADGWQRRIEFEKNFSNGQVAACERITTDDTVLDACCGTGRLTIPLAQRAKYVYGLDASAGMLEWCKKNAVDAGLDNVETILVDNWHNCTPGKEIPIVDVAVACISPAQGDLVKFSKCAKKYCYSLSFSHVPYRHCMWELFEDAGQWGVAGSRKPVEGQNSMQQELKRQRLLGLNVAFNLLWDLGAYPEVGYVDGGWEHEADTKEELYSYLAGFGAVDPGKEERFHANCDKRIKETPEGRWHYAYPTQMYVLGWDPNQLR